MSPTKKTDDEQQKFYNYRFNEIDKKLERIESKMDGFTFAKQSDLNDFIVYARANYATKEELSPIKKVFYFILTFTIGSTIGFMFWLLQKAVK